MQCNVGGQRSLCTVKDWLTQKPGHIMFDGKSLVIKFGAINTFTTSSVCVLKITTWNENEFLKKVTFIDINWYVTKARWENFKMLYKHWKKSVCKIGLVYGSNFGWGTYVTFSKVHALQKNSYPSNLKSDPSLKSINPKLGN